MKRILLTLGAFAALTFSTQAQLIEHDYIQDILVPEHVQQKLEEIDFMGMTYSMTKNNSFDAPLLIQQYDVDLLQNETLNKVYAFTYSSAGELRQRVKMDAAAVNEQRLTYNFNEFGEYTSVIHEDWNGAAWLFDYRKVMTYSGTGLLLSETFENYTGFDWEFSSSNRYEYIGNEATPSQVKGYTTDDGINWEEGIRINFTYNGTTPSEVEVVIFDQNYLYWTPVEKWVISDWGPKPFRADLFFNPRDGINKVTDNTINKYNGFDLYPAEFMYHTSYDYNTGLYDDLATIESTYDQGNRTYFLVREFNGVDFDSTGRYTLEYDPCFGYKSMLSEEYVSPGVWTITSGNDFEGYTTTYSGSCFAYAYNYFENFSDLELNGIRTKRWVISQATDLGTGELNPNTFKVYPNPATNSLQISMDASEFNISITSMDGKTVINREKVSLDQPIDIASIPSGVYLIMVTANGESTVQKFIKE